MIIDSGADRRTQASFSDARRTAIGLASMLLSIALAMFGAGYSLGSQQNLATLEQICARATR